MTRFAQHLSDHVNFFLAEISKLLKMSRFWLCFSIVFILSESRLTNSMQAFIFDQSWGTRKWDLQRTDKAMQRCVHTMYKDCREHVNRKTAKKWTFKAITNLK